MRLTNATGVNVVYDSVGKTTFDQSLKCLAVRGVLALFGQSSGPVPPVDPLRLWKNSVFLTRPALADYTRTRTELLERASDVLGWVMSGKLQLRISQILPLKEAAEAHRLLQARKTTGKVLLVLSVTLRDTSRAIPRARSGQGRFVCVRSWRPCRCPNRMKVGLAVENALEVFPRVVLDQVVRQAHRGHLGLRGIPS
jgi:hypothetical protein